jgi:hypothetical protein
MRVAVLAGMAAGTLIALQTAIIGAFGERLPPSWSRPGCTSVGSRSRSGRCC